MTLDNPVFATFAISAALMVIKLMGQGWITVYRMMKIRSGFASPEDAKAGPFNPDPKPGQTDYNDYVDRSRRMHRNDIENIPAFLAIGLLFVFVAPPLILAQLLMYGFVVARILHTLAYATAQSHEVRSVPYTVGSLIVIYMAVHVLVVAIATHGPL
ncbi:MAPEG family protein [Pelagibacterium halotolerans]|uniref:MAPEG family protein n=1 Tax=Pelagibacterium halotolerans TaxID=531813 RepID=UPI00384F8F28